MISNQSRSVQSNLFQAYRALGYVTADSPFCVHYRGSEAYLTTSTGSHFQTFDVAHLRLKFVSSAVQDGKIVDIFESGLTTLVVTSTGFVQVYRRGKRVHQWRPDRWAGEPVCQLLMGDHLIMVDSENVLRVCECQSGEVYSEVPLGNRFHVRQMLHPDTYLNKILLASDDGCLQLWNIRTNKLIYEFKTLGAPIVSLAQTPVVDVVAIGLNDGRILIHNIRSDKTVMQFKQDDRVSAFAFRTDEHPIMATASVSGDVYLWDLEKKRLVHTMKEVHNGVVSGLHFLRGQPLLITSGSDNSIKEWVFDGFDGLPRLLRSRSGHHAPPSSIRYYDTDGQIILSTGRDRALRLFSVFRDEQNMELSQGSLKKHASNMNVNVDELKLPYPTSVSSATLRERDWDNIVTCHLNSNVAKSWSFSSKSIGKYDFKSMDGTNVKCTAVSCCGNFALIGCQSGRIDLFNIQSGLYRRSFYNKNDKHTKAVVGVAVDARNRLVMSASLDGSVRLWDFVNGACVETFQLECAVDKICFNTDNDLLAVACDDMCIRIFDIDTRRLVREFHGHSHRITDMTFSDDGRWLVSSSLDATIRTWDLPSGYCIDRFKVDSIATGLAFSPSGDYLASIHVNSVGVYLWANRSRFQVVPHRRVPDEDDLESVPVVSMPSIDGTDQAYLQVEEGDPFMDDSIVPTLTPPKQMRDGMVTLSLEPKTKWQNLMNLETIKKRQKPKEAPKAPEKAPFFLPTIQGLDPKFQIEKTESESDATSHIFKMGDLRTESEFSRLLALAANATEEQDEAYCDFMAHMTSLSASAMDFEIRSLSLENDLLELRNLLNILLIAVESGKNFELIQSYLAAILKIHADVMLANPEHFTVILEQYQQKQLLTWTRIEHLFQKSMCLMDFIRKTI